MKRSSVGLVLSGGGARGAWEAGVMLYVLVSYLLFDGEHAGALIDLGIADARGRHDELCSLLVRASAETAA